MTPIKSVHSVFPQKCDFKVALVTPYNLRHRKRLQILVQNLRVKLLYIPLYSKQKIVDYFEKHLYQIIKLEDLKVLKRSPDLLNNNKIVKVN